MSMYINRIRNITLKSILPTKKYADLIIPQGGENKTGIHILKTYIEGIVK